MRILEWGGGWNEFWFVGLRIESEPLNGAENDPVGGAARFGSHLKTQKTFSSKKKNNLQILTFEIDLFSFLEFVYLF